ncbi:hypothetical protein CYLTODRAFT_441987 [Cylindrobasidium torrendii FP15055 ss-10]|uniref:Uncharacterized protein n=1 Tax=Cylindrobasidium torrendii FP15055 ss-10 TaxID=1314674 RepID=A0A0D7BLC7_9AGAR|nr:hypothetical protein CYLTODRAFT_441987 [Cylindrobasidium torrendii FP15055 ss-10]
MRDELVIFLRFERADRSCCGIAASDAEFETLPAEQHLVVRGFPMSTCEASGKRVQLTYDNLNNWRAWNSDERPRAVYFKAEGQVNGRTKHFCVKMMPNWPTALRTYYKGKGGSCPLKDDAEFYAKHLRHRAKILPFIPKQYGMWIAATREFVGSVLFSVSDWVGANTFVNVRNTWADTPDVRALIAHHVEVLHEQAILHNGLASIPLLHHVLLDMTGFSKANPPTRDRLPACYIVDFSKADAKHACARTLPFVKLDVCVLFENFQCFEGWNVLIALNLMPKCRPTSDDKVDSQARKALDWIHEYDAKIPLVDSIPWSVMQHAQRLCFWKLPLLVDPALLGRRYKFVDEEGNEVPFNKEHVTEETNEVFQRGSTCPQLVVEKIVP